MFSKSKKPRTHKSRAEQRKDDRAQVRTNTVTIPSGPGSGEAEGFALREWQGSTWGTCGMWPFVNGSPAPLHGAQIGVHQDTNLPVGCDPLGWHDAGIIANPSVFLLSQPSGGKSTLLRKMMIGSVANGTPVLVLGDPRNEHTDTILAIGGTVIHLGPGEGKLNILDPGQTLEAVELIRASGHEDTEAIVLKLIEKMHVLRLNSLMGLIQINRGDDLTGQERAIIDGILRHLHEDQDEPAVPILDDVLRVLLARPERVKRAVNAWREDRDHYREITERLENDLIALTSGGGIGAMFNGPTTKPIRRNQSTAFDISRIPESDEKAIAAAYIACWTAGFGMAEVHHALADAKVAPRVRYFAVLDEFWKPLGASSGMVQRIDAITRLNRDKGIACAFASHTMKDAASIPNEYDRIKASEFVTRAGAIILGGLRREELEDRIAPLVNLRPEEIDLVASWNSTGSYSTRKSTQTRPGLGKFLIKVGEEPGIPVRTVLTPKEIELGLHDTNKRIRKEGVAA